MRFSLKAVKGAVRSSSSIADVADVVAAAAAIDVYFILWYMK